MTENVAERCLQERCGVLQKRMPNTGIEPMTFAYSLRVGARRTSAMHYHCGHGRMLARETMQRHAKRRSQARAYASQARRLSAAQVLALLYQFWLDPGAPEKFFGIDAELCKPRHRRKLGALPELGDDRLLGHKSAVMLEVVVDHLLFALPGHAGPNDLAGSASYALRPRRMMLGSYCHFMNAE